MLYGYIRVSTVAQHMDRQEDAFRDFQIPEKNIFSDKQSGKDFERPSYRKMLSKLKEGDILVVKSIDRLGRNYEEILEQWRRITKDIKAEIVVIDMPLLDTRKSNDLTGVVIADIVLQLLSYVAQTERQFLKQRQKEGIKSAKNRGVKFGRPVLEKPVGYEEIVGLWKKNMISGREASRRLGIHHKTFQRWMEKEGSAQNS